MLSCSVFEPSYSSNVIEIFAMSVSYVAFIWLVHSMLVTENH